MKYSQLASALSVALFSYASFSSDTLPTDDVDETHVVIANRFAQSPSSVLASMTVVTREDIEALQVTTALDVLETMPGIEVNKLGGKGQTSSLYLRGTPTKHTLVIVDGVKINSATAGGASIGLIPAFAIERIEVVRGPRAAVYGSDAIGGVISITTLSAQDKRHQTKVGYGTENQSLLAWRSAGQLNEQTQGALIIANERSTGSEIYEMTPEDHGFEAFTALGSLAHQFNQQWSAQFHSYRLDSGSEYASQYGGAKQENLVEFYTLAAALKFNRENWYSQWQLSTTHDHAQDGDVRGLVAKTALEAKRHSVSWLTQYQASPNLDVNVGIDLEREDAQRGGANTTQYVKTKKDNLGVFGTALYRNERTTLEASMRHDDDSAFGNHTTWTIGAGVNLWSGVELLASSGTSFKAPTFNDLYWPGQGNPNLKPETSISHEVGLRFYNALVDIELAAYQNDLDDMIAWAPIGENGLWLPANVEKARIRGVELEARFDTGSIAHTVAAEWKDPENRADGKQLIRRAKQNYAWTAIYRHDRVDWSAVVNYIGKRPDSTGSDMKAYTTVDLSARYQVTGALTLGARVDNLFNEDFQTAHGYDGNYYLGEQRQFFADMTYQF
ncbi:TonB-dependent receptor [Vibrio sp. SM6]|uniref:TonB-dependent receptor n=1 Tax=Vibrio agarilyticus TaxID=2726741 RepID=A0A7X8TRS9_9VIBR|nr:TonB-dependent receptor [Vibrio agarilyticus]NLS13620.1 TonB-dependent receptor [Vibrio agarilyticus]